MTSSPYQTTWQFLFNAKIPKHIKVTERIHDPRRKQLPRRLWHSCESYSTGCGTCAHHTSKVEAPQRKSRPIMLLRPFYPRASTNAHIVGTPYVNTTTWFGPKKIREWLAKVISQNMAKCPKIQCLRGSEYTNCLNKQRKLVYANQYFLLFLSPGPVVCIYIYIYMESQPHLSLLSKDSMRSQKHSGRSLKELLSVKESLSFSAAFVTCLSPLSLGKALRRWYNTSVTATLAKAAGMTLIPWTMLALRVL